jgi:DNA-binding NtrC family response regulator
MAVPSAELIVLDGPDRGRQVRLAGGLARIGSGPGNQLCLTDHTVSRMHCEITSISGTLRLRDTNSTNGTFIDGVRIFDAEVTPGALVRLGNTVLRIDQLDQPELVELSSRDRFGPLLGGSAPMRRLYAILDRIAPSEATVLVQGETGTGKELVAQAIHENSHRRQGPFVTVDCATLPENLVESELFGHVRGAFSGAHADRDGAFEQARGGTLFFDEIGELPLPLQSKLLRAIESRQLRRVGSDKARAVDVRVIAATNRSLAAAVNQGQFREDLYYRLAVVELELPPLRSRRDDIPLLIAHFHGIFSGSDQAVPEALVDWAKARSWNGNVRELRNYIQRVVCLGLGSTSIAPAARTESSERPELPLHLPLKEARMVWLEQFDAAYLRATLQRTQGNVSRAAELSGVNRRLLHRMLARLGMSAKQVIR